MKILITSSSYPQHDKDWKSVFIKQLLHSIANIPGNEVSYWGPPGSLDSGIDYVCNKKEAAWLDLLMQKGGVIHLVRQGGKGLLVPFKLLFLLKLAYKRNKAVDIFHINWLQNALSVVGTKQPIVVNVLGSDFGLLKIPAMTFLLRMILKNRRAIIAPNADWMVSPLEQKFGDIAKIVFVPLGIDDQWYRLERKVDRLNPQKWLSITRLTKKKIGKLFEWGQNVFNSENGHELHLFGPMQEEIIVPDWVCYHGATYPDELRQKWFPQASGLVTLSEHDEGRPQVMLESMAAGVPIIASCLPAHENIIKHKKTGWLTASRDDFRDGIEWLSVIDNNNAVAAKAKAEVKKSIGTWEDCAARYCELYKRLLIKD